MEKISFRTLPDHWSRSIDVIPLMTLQYALDPALEIYYLKGHVSVPFPKISPKREPIVTELGGTITQGTTRRGGTDVVYGRRIPTYFRLTQREILEDITANAPRLRYPEVDEELIPEIVLKRRGIREKIPQEFEDIEVFQGNEEVFYQQTSKGNRTPSLRKMFGLPLCSPYDIAKNGLLLHGIVGPKDPVFKRLRGVLINNWIGVGTDRLHNKGWRALEDYGKQLQTKFVRDRWWQDLAIPHPFSDTIDSRTVKSRVYILEKRDDLFAI